MGESPSARTERELAELRGEIDADLDALLRRARSDIDPRTLLLITPGWVQTELGAPSTPLTIVISSLN